jgi:signal transduction histidine kinase
MEYAADIHRSGHHLLELVNDLLDMARIEVGMVNLQEDAMDIATLIREVVQLASGSVPEATYDFDIRVPASAQMMIADRRRMKQMLINLIGNAVKFTPHGGRIRIAVSEGDQHMLIAISDTGIGIPPEKIGELCQPFSQIESGASRRYEGSGMGLFITRALAERHGGDLKIASRLGEGTTITIRLPADRLVRAFGKAPLLIEA